MRLKFVKHFALFLTGFAVLSTGVALFRGNDVFAPGGPAAAFVAALLITLPFAFIADLIASRRRRRGTDSAAIPAGTPAATDRH